MRHPELVALIGLAGVILGCGMRYFAGRARFLHRNAIGLLVFNAYPNALAFQTANRAGDRLGWGLIALGATLLVSGMIEAGTY